MDTLNSISLHGQRFVPYLDANTIATRINEMARHISKDYEGKVPLFIGVLNGSFLFAADLFRALTLQAELSFVKLASYKGMSSSGEVVTAIGLDVSVRDRHVIVLEDIIDTGKTLYEFLPQLKRQNPASLSIATLLTKPGALQYPVRADYIGFNIPDKFVVGYGLDYDGLGRNIPEIYQLAGSLPGSAEDK